MVIGILGLSLELETWNGIWNISILGLSLGLNTLNGIWNVSILGLSLGLDTWNDIWNVSILWVILDFMSRFSLLFDHSLRGKYGDGLGLDINHGNAGAWLNSL